MRILSQSWWGITVALAALALWASSPAVAQTGSPRLSLKAAAGATEVPAGPWGSYSLRHAGPCYLASRRLTPLFAFPIVVSQQREEFLAPGSRGTDGKTRLLPERVTLLRRASGLAPTDASRDAEGTPGVARIVDADSDGLGTIARIVFREALPAQRIVGRRAPDGGALPPAPWPAATATVRWSPVYADEAEGLLVRVTLTNPGAEPQSFCIDLLGGLDRPDPLFPSSDVTLETDADGRGIAFRHAKLDTWFALAGQPGDIGARSLPVAANLFGASANVCARDAAGFPQPPPASGAPAEWGLTRIAGIAVEPGATRTIALCIGIGRNADAALTAARTLLSLSEEKRDAAGASRETLGALADRAHEKARYGSGSAAVDALMAQSLANLPFQDMRRVGVPTREGGARYRPGLGGWTALGWTRYRPDWAAAQVNAWLLTELPPRKTVDNVFASPPTDLFALWQLVQQTHDRDMLERFYPYAAWRFRQLLESGRDRQDDWLFTWPRSATAAGDAGRPGGGEPVRAVAPVVTPRYSPEYSAYVMLSARILLACAKTLDRPADEQASFGLVIDNASRALTTLWDPGRGLFVARPVAGASVKAASDRGDGVEADRLECLLPFILGRDILTAEQDEALRKHLADAATFLSGSGLRSHSANSPAYRAGQRDDGGVRFGDQWLLWKAYLDRGDGAHAADLAARVLGAYEEAVKAADGCPEWLNGDTGAAAGALDFSGDSCALIALHAAYHRPGTVSSGWETNLLDDHYDSVADSTKVIFRTVAREAGGVLLCVMGKPGGKYRAAGAIAGEFAADAAGVLTLPIPHDTTTQQVEITPAAGTAQSAP
jgi:hypothetical protein